MTAKHGSGTFRSESGMLLDGLALSVISRVSASPHHRRNRRIDVATKTLLAAVLDRGFDQDAVLADLGSLRISPIDIVDHCIPLAARELGQAWVDDRLSFARVTVGSAALYALCKTVGTHWYNIRPPINARSVLLTTIGREDHILGPAVLADQLRRRGHSVHVHSGATAATIDAKLESGRYDGVFVSVSNSRGLTVAAEEIKKLRSSGSGIPVVLGGAILTLDGITVKNTGADLVTNDIDDALDALSGAQYSFRVAE